MKARDVRSYADYYYSTKYYSRMESSPVGRDYDTYYIRPSKQYGNQKYAHKFGIDQYADKVKKYKDATVRQISYYSFLCSNFDTSCTECTLIDQKKAKCPKDAFCFMKDEQAQCGSCLKFGKRCTGCNLTTGCTECVAGYWQMGGNCFKSLW